MKLKRGDLVGVLWEDAWANSRWQGDPETKKPQLPVEQVGFLVAQNKQGIWLASGRALVDDAAPWLSMGFVPAGMVRRVRLLRRCQRRFL